jgi:DTW domain-containing protein YfiP
MRPVCPRCALPVPSCLCRWVTPTANRVPLLVLQHPQEVDQAKGSVRLLRLSLAQCHCAAVESIDAPSLAARLAAAAGQGPRPLATTAPVLLFPGGDPGGGPGADPWQSVTGPLVLLDGTWRQARRLLAASPVLQALPRWALPAPPPARYTIRRAQRPEQRSTLEAACLALGLLEDRRAHYQPLLAAFDAWVASVAARQPR